MKPRSHCLHYGSFISFGRDIRLPTGPASLQCQYIGYGRSSHSNSVNSFARKSPSGLHSAHWEPPYNKRRDISGMTRRDSEIIFPDNLAATLEAHRAENRARVIRKVRSDVERCSADFYRPLIRNVESQEGDILASEEVKSTPRSDIKKIPVSGEFSEALSTDLPEKQDIPIEEGNHKRLSSSKHKVINIRRIKQGKAKTPSGYLEYEGRNVAPCDEWARASRRPFDNVATGSHSPWLDFMGKNYSDNLARLGGEVRAYESYMSLTQSELRNFASIHESVQKITAIALPSATVRVIGSYCNGLAVPTSDIDFRLVLPGLEKKPLDRGPSPGRRESRKKRHRALYELKRALTLSESFCKSEIIPAKVSIIKAVHRRTKLTIDIQVSSPDIAPQMYTEMYLTEFRTLRPLYVLLKMALEIRGLNTTFDGGLGSYSIFMMIVYALKTCPPSIQSDDCASQLLHLLEVYALADFSKQGFTVNPPAIFNKSGVPENNEIQPSHHDSIQDRHETKEQPPYRMYLQDPADPQNDLGAKAHAIKHVQKVFACAAHAIKQTLKVRPIHAERSEKGMLDSLIGANYDTFNLNNPRNPSKISDNSSCTTRHLTKDGRIVEAGTLVSGNDT